MRIQLQLSSNTEPVPYNHLHNLTGAIHKWLGDNTAHDGLSLYSFGWLRGGQPKRGSLHFPSGAAWNISFHDDELARQLIKGIMADPSIAYGMTVQEVREIAPPTFKEQHIFATDGSAVLARRKREDGSREYLLWDSLAANEVLTHLLRKKLEIAGFSGENLNARVAFDRAYARPRPRMATIKGIKHKGSECPVIVEGTPEAIQFAWLVGVGDLTGSGFGSLR